MPVCFIQKFEERESRKLPKFLNCCVKRKKWRCYLLHRCNGDDDFQTPILFTQTIINLEWEFRWTYPSRCCRRQSDLYSYSSRNKLNLGHVRFIYTTYDFWRRTSVAPNHRIDWDKSAEILSTYYACYLETNAQLTIDNIMRDLISKIQKALLYAIIMPLLHFIYRLPLLINYLVEEGGQIRVEWKCPHIFNNISHYCL